MKKKLTCTVHVWPVTLVTIILQAPFAGPEDAIQSLTSHSTTPNLCILTPTEEWISRDTSSKIASTAVSSWSAFMSNLLTKISQISDNDQRLEENCTFYQK